MTVKEIESNARQRMEKALADLQHAMAGIRTGRASVGLLEGIRVDYYGTPTPLNQVATLHVPEPSMITAAPWDPSQIGAIEKAIRASDLGLNPNNDGKIIRIPIPPLTQERRQSLVKHLHGVAEEHRVAIRNIRRDTMHDLRELRDSGEAGADDEHRAEEALQKLTDEKVRELDALVKAKEEEILEV